VLDDLYRVGVKLFCTAGVEIDLVEFIPVFHRWIQQRTIPGILIDVADYSHLHEGPGILLVCHEGNLAVDEGEGRRGLCYYRKRPCPGSLEERVLEAAAYGARAALQLASEPEWNGRLRFGGEELLVFANDRLLAPNEEDTLSAFRPVLERLAEAAFGTGAVDLRRASDPRERFQVTLRGPGPVDLQRLAGSGGA